MAPVEGAISELVLPVSALLLDNHGALTAILIPVAMQAAVVSEVLRMGAAEFATVTVVAMHVPVTANPHIERLGARKRRSFTVAH